MWKEKLKIYDALVALVPEIERKGKTMPYTSSNGYMFSLYNKDCEIGIRFSKDRQSQLLEKLNTTVYKSYGATMKGYVLIPDGLLNDLPKVADLLKESYDYVNTLKPK